MIGSRHQPAIGGGAHRRECAGETRAVAREAGRRRAVGEVATRSAERGEGGHEGSVLEEVWGTPTAVAGLRTWSAEQ